MSLFIQSQASFVVTNIPLNFMSKFFITDLLASENYTAELNENFDYVAPICFSFEGNEKKSTKEVADILREAYLPHDTIDVRSFTGLKNLISDGIIGVGVHRFVRYISNFTDVYYYRFSYPGRYSRFYHPRDQPYGVHHIDDIQYIFYSFFMSHFFQPADPESIIVERMTRIWEQFATTG